MKIILSVIIAVMLVGSGAMGQTPTPTPTPGIYKQLTIAWDRSSAPALVSYRLYASTTAPVSGKFTAPISPPAFTIPASTQAPATSVTYTFPAPPTLPDGTYYVAVVAIDATNTESPYSNVVQATVITAAPVPPTNLRIVSQSVTVAARVARIRWSTNDKSRGIVLYRKNGGVALTKLDKGSSTNHEIRLDRLSPGSYSYQIVAMSKKDSVTSLAQPFTVL